MPRPETLAKFEVDDICDYLVFIRPKRAVAWLRGVPPARFLWGVRAGVSSRTNRFSVRACRRRRPTPIEETLRIRSEPHQCAPRRLDGSCLDEAGCWGGGLRRRRG